MQSGAPQPFKKALPFLLLYFLVAVLLQWNAGAFRTEFGSYHDEPAHYV
ncbi:MAG: hypothetical protein HKN12_05775, partial [Gemmatimonadetes bacterium]|nr:hypothetical protein [Gemmatimonadota bacterium]